MLKTLKIRDKLYIGFAIVILLALAISVAAYLSISSLRSSIHTLSGKSIPQISILSDLTQDVLSATIHLSTALVATSREKMDKEIETMLKTRTSLNDSYDKLKATLTTEKEKALFQAILDKRKPAAAKRDEIVKLAKQGNLKQAILTLDEFDPLQTQYLDAIDEMEKHIRAAAQNNAAAAEDKGQMTSLFIIFLSLSAAVMAFGVAFYVVRIITRPLDSAVGHAECIAQGDLTTAIEPTTSDEMGRLLHAMRNMGDKLKGIIGNIRQVSASVASGSEQLSASSEEITRTMNEQTNRTSQIAAAAEEMSQTVIDIAKNSASIAESASETVQIADKGAEKVNKATNESRAIATTVENSVRVMQTLGDRSKQIGDIVSVINDIADQTNLLALNAAIEAARAGEQGRGFAVVADEVRKLAERTAKATSEIVTMISAIQLEVGNAVKAMDDTSKKVETGLQYSTEAGNELNTIVQSIQALQGMVQQIATATEQMSSTAEAISGDIQAVSTGTKELSLGSDQIAQSSSELAKLAGQLNSIVTQFKV